MKTRMRCLLVSLMVACASTAIGLVAQGYDDEPDGCCWIHFWTETAYLGDDDIAYGPGDWPDASDWEGQVGSLKVGECASVTVWTKEQYEGESATLEAELQLNDYAAAYVNSMKMTCDD